MDGRPIKIEIIVSGDKAAAIAPAPKGLTDRISQPKSQPKSAAPNKKKEAAAKVAGTAGAAARGGRRAGRAKSSRPAKKSAEELDSEMADYFEANNSNENTAGAAPAAATNGDAPMEDEILVCYNKRDVCENRNTNVH